MILPLGHVASLSIIPCLILECESDLIFHPPLLPPHLGSFTSPSVRPGITSCPLSRAHVILARLLKYQQHYYGCQSSYSHGPALLYLIGVPHVGNLPEGGKGLGQWRRSLYYGRTLLSLVFAMMYRFLCSRTIIAVFLVTTIAKRL